MRASLVGSEMCIRDRSTLACAPAGAPTAAGASASRGTGRGRKRTGVQISSVRTGALQLLSRSWGGTRRVRHGV
eukprot:11587357-Alexandrium_andersonii.AAC.1